MSEERKMVLMMLKEGTISADEAERLLNALREPATTDKKEQEEKKSETAELSEFVDWERWEERKQTYKQQSSGFRLGQYIENIVQKLKSADFDMNFGTYETVNHIYQDATAKFQHVLIEVKNGSITIVPWKERYIQVDCEAQVYRAADRERARQRFFEEVRLDIAADTVRFISDARDVKVNATMHIPEKMIEFVECKLFNGSITSDALTATDLRIKTMNGSITCTNFSAHRAELETGNGTITASGQANIGEFETINGAIEVSGSFRDLDVESFSGALTAELQSDGYASLRSTTGGITTYVPGDVRVDGDLASAIGSIRCELRSFEVLREKKEFARRRLKFVTNKKLDRLLIVEASTKTGSVSVAEREA